MRFEFWAVAVAVWAAAELLRKYSERMLCSTQLFIIDLLIDLLCPYKEVTADNLTLYFLWPPS